MIDSLFVAASTPCALIGEEYPYRLQIQFNDLVFIQFFN